MISELVTRAKKFRAFGWVQDPSNFRSLCDVVSIFDAGSRKRSELANETIPRLVSDSDGKQRLINALNGSPLKITYSDLVGSAFSPRSAGRCNGIVQAAIKGQSRGFISDWPAENFVRWAHALGFIMYDYDGDSFEITDAGILLSRSKTDGDALNNQEKEILTRALLSYPPAVRILSLLSHGNAHMSKFELGKKYWFRRGRRLFKPASIGAYKGTGSNRKRGRKEQAALELGRLGG